MSSVRSSGVGPDDLPVAGWVATALWILVGGGAAAVAVRDSTGSGRLIFTMAIAVSAAALVAGLALWWRTERIGWFVGGLLVSAVTMPTVFAYVLALVPAVTAFALLVWARRRVGDPVDLAGAHAT